LDHAGYSDQQIDRKGSLGSYYAVSDYRSVNPEFGTMDDFKSLVKQAQDQGFKIITDWLPVRPGLTTPGLQPIETLYAG
jgi:maltooligosyltrehalose synthase